MDLQGRNLVVQAALEHNETHLLQKECWQKALQHAPE